MDNSKLTTPVAIVIGCLILGFFYFMAETSEEEELKVSVVNNDCELPPIWGEVKSIYKDCSLEEIEKSTGFSDTFHFSGGNGSFGYCNSLVWRKYSNDDGLLYTYEKVRSQHFPNSEVGEYRAPEALYEDMTNSRPCTPSSAGVESDDDISSVTFPSRNRSIDLYEPEYWASFFSKNYEDYGWQN